jgi:hypothetical protein
MSNSTAPKGDSVTQTNASTTNQIARAANMDSRDASSTTNNTISIDQSNLQIGSMGTGLNSEIVQANHITAEQLALAVNSGSFDSNYFRFRHMPGRG